MRTAEKKAKHAAYMRAWLAANPEKRRRTAEQLAQAAARARDRRKTEPEKQRAASRKYRLANRDELCALARDRAAELRAADPLKKKRICAEMGVYYIGGLLKIPVAQLTPELLELKRLDITIYRELRALKKGTP